MGELEGTDTVVPVDAGSIGNSLFCFSVYRKDTGVHDADDQALDLLTTNHKYSEGIFACDSWRVFSDVDASLGDYKAIKVPGDDLSQSKRPEEEEAAIEGFLQRLRPLAALRQG